MCAVLVEKSGEVEEETEASMLPLVFTASLAGFMTGDTLPSLPDTEDDDAARLRLRRAGEEPRAGESDLRGIWGKSYPMAMS